MPSSTPAIRFAVIGLDHAHVFSMAATLRRAGAELAAVLPEGGLADGFAKLFPDAPPVRDRREILDDASIELVISAAIPDERAAIGVEAMHAGKDFLVDKPGMTDLDQLERVRAVQRETGRFYHVYFSERLGNAATVRAGELAAAGVIGRVLHTVGLGPHRLAAKHRPAWFFERARYGGILTDIGAHQADQFLFFTGAQSARVAASRVANHAHPEHPGLEDFGEMLLEGESATGYVRVDWFTPDGLPTWGDGRLMVVGTEGTLEVRKEIDLDGRPGASHLFVVDRGGVRREDCSGVEAPFAAQFLRDVRERTETAMPQAHSFRASELALRAQAQATVVPGTPEIER